MPTRIEMPVECITRLILLAHWGKETARTMVLLTGLSMVANRNQAYQLGMKPSLRKIWSERMEKLLMDNYHSKTNLELAKMLDAEFPLPGGRKYDHYNHVRNQLTILGCKRTKKELFDVKSRNQVNSWERGVYKHLDPPGITYPIGAFVLRTARKKMVLYYKVEEYKWVTYKNYIWELHFGKIPEGKAIICIDGNPENVVIENLLAIDKIDKAHAEMTNLTDNAIIGILKRTRPVSEKKTFSEEVKEFGGHIIDFKRTDLEFKRKFKSVKKDNPTPRKKRPELSEEQKTYIIAHYGKEPTSNIATLIKADLIDIYELARKLNLKGAGVTIWGEAAVKFLIENYRTSCNKKIAWHLNNMFPDSKRKFTLQKVNMKLSRLGLSRSPEEHLKIQQQAYTWRFYKI